jgi:hypothetical protein
LGKKEKARGGENEMNPRNIFILIFSSSMLNSSFAQADWTPDSSVSYQCSPPTSATGFTYLMALVMSGRDSVTRKLTRQNEFDAFLDKLPNDTDVCRQTNSEGWTALMLAVRNSNSDSTEAAVARLLAHPSSGEAARMRNNLGRTALMLATRSSNTESTESTVALLLAHESGKDVARMRTYHNAGCTALLYAVCNSSNGSSEATVAMLLTHESSSQVVRMLHNEGQSVLMRAACNANTSGTEATVAMLVPHVDAADFQHASRAHPSAFHTHLCRLHESTQERAILSTALRQGLSLVEAITLLYL